MGGIILVNVYSAANLIVHTLMNFNNLLFPGCPLSVVVSGGADASLVTCSGVGLSQGVVGREIRSWIDTRRAGPGELTAHCTGNNTLLSLEGGKP